jgi:microcompartment protein CcmK/EutM
MTLGRVAGTVVSTRKDERLSGFKLLVVMNVDPEGKDRGSYVVAVDTVDAGLGDLVLLVSGSSARMAAGCENRPIDAAIVGVIDAVELAARAAAAAGARAGS